MARTTQDALNDILYDAERAKKELAELVEQKEYAIREKAIQKIAKLVAHYEGIGGTVLVYGGEVAVKNHDDEYWQATDCISEFTHGEIAEFIWDQNGGKFYVAGTLGA